MHINRADLAPPGVGLGLAIVAWTCLVAGGMGLLIHYGAKPGAAGNPPTTWPADSLLPADEDQDRLLVFLHPRCPCSRATLRQLERAMAHRRGRPIEVQAIVFTPSGREGHWSQTDLFQSAAQMPGWRVFADADGRETRRFGIRTSGQVLMFDAQQRLVFSGGVTPGRGHEGASVGLDALIALLRGDEPGHERAPVYGCPIFQQLTESSAQEVAQCPCSE